MEKQISIIIPTYNMEAYIGKCLDSLLIPEFDAVEVLVVNDGSKDRSSEIAHSYADRYPGSIRVIDKPNGNYGSCINAALPLATGRYIKVLDADDTFDTAAFSSFVNQIESVHSDAIALPYNKVDEHGEVIRLHDFAKNKPVFGKLYELDAAEGILSDCYIEMHHLAYSKEIFNRFRYVQTEGISYTDNEWTILPLSYCSSIVFLNIPVYKYLIGRQGQTVDSVNIPKFIPTVFDILERLFINNNFATSEFFNKQFFRKMLIERYKMLYWFVKGNLNPQTMDVLSVHDRWLYENFSDCYEILGETRLYPKINYRVITDIRKKKYSPQFRVPLSTRLLAAIRNRLF